MSFWKQLAEARAAGRPTVLKQAFMAPDTNEVFDWMCQGAATRALKLRVYRPGALEIVRNWHQPTRDDGTIGGYLGRLESQLGTAGIVVNDLQASCPAAWRRLQPMLSELFTEMPIPSGGASFEIFSGAYRTGLFGVHKDDQDVITFVLEGKKRFRLWPYPYFADQPDVAPDSETRPHAFRDLDVAPHLQNGVVLEGEPGDVFFWPAEWWHQAESDGDQCTTLGIGLFRGVTSNQLVEQVALTIDGEPEMPRVQGRADLGVAQRTLELIVHHAELRDRVEGRYLAFTSGFGCRAFPQPGDEPLPEAPQRVVGNLTWAERDDSVGWAVNGVPFRYPSRPPILRLFERLAAGAPFVPSQLAAELADEEVGADALEHILGLLHRHHALTAVAGLSRSAEVT